MLCYQKEPLSVGRTLSTSRNSLMERISWVAAIIGVVFSIFAWIHDKRAKQSPGSLSTGAGYNTERQWTKLQDSRAREMDGRVTKAESVQSAQPATMLPTSLSDFESITISAKQPAKAFNELALSYVIGNSQYCELNVNNSITGENVTSESFFVARGLFRSFDVGEKMYTLTLTSADDPMFGQSSCTLLMERITLHASVSLTDVQAGGSYRLAANPVIDRQIVSVSSDKSVVALGDVMMTLGVTNVDVPVCNLRMTLRASGEPLTLANGSSIPADPVMMGVNKNGYRYGFKAIGASLGASVVQCRVLVQRRALASF